MGMTDNQFKGFIRFVLDAILDAQAEENAEKRDAKMAKIIDNLQKVLED